MLDVTSVRALFLERVSGVVKEVNSECGARRQKMAVVVNAAPIHHCVVCPIGITPLCSRCCPYPLTSLLECATIYAKEKDCLTRKDDREEGAITCYILSFISFSMATLRSCLVKLLVLQGLHIACRRDERVH
jgi:hypothetical protein